MFAHNFASCCLHHARAPVVAEAAPALEQSLLARLGERLESWEPFQEAFVVGNDGRDTSLLQHDLRDPDAVGIAGPAPGQVPLVTAIPAKKGVDQLVIPGFWPTRFQQSVQVVRVTAD